MESLRKEIEQEMKRTRLDKARLYDLLLKIIDNCGSKAPAPVAKAPETAPVAKAPETAPVAKAPETAPVAKAPETAPVAKAPETAPVAKAPETAPVAKAPPKTTTVTKKVPVKKKVVTA